MNYFKNIIFSRALFFPSPGSWSVVPLRGDGEESPVVGGDVVAPEVGQISAPVPAAKQVNVLEKRNRKWMQFKLCNLKCQFLQQGFRI